MAGRDGTDGSGPTASAGQVPARGAVPLTFTPVSHSGPVEDSSARMSTMGSRPGSGERARSGSSEGARGGGAAGAAAHSARLHSRASTRSSASRARA